jgi:hypothetical protein
MGLLRSMLDLHRQARQIEKTYDPVAQAAQSRRFMQAMTQQLAEQSSVAELRHTGLAGTATLTAVRDTGSRLDHQPLVELDLLVMVPGRPPYPVTLRTVVPIMGMGAMQPGRALAVWVDPVQPQRVAVAWEQTPAQ